MSIILPFIILKQTMFVMYAMKHKGSKCDENGLCVLNFLNDLSNAFVVQR